MNRPTTIQFFLPNGEPRGIRIAEITTRIVQAVLVPRSKLSEAGKRGELSNVGVYLLLGESEEAAKPIVYIGEAEDCYSRLKQHNANKDFWQVAIAIVSKTNSFTKAHAKFLEWKCIDQATKVGRFTLENGNGPSKPFVTEPMEADLLDAFETLNTLTSTLGYPVFEQTQKVKVQDRYHCAGRGANGVAEYSEDGMVVLKGSTGKAHTTDSSQPYIKRTREKLLKDGVIVEKEGIYEFTSDYIFGSPSAAASVVTGRNCNGWIEWKRKDGKTLDEVERKQE